MSSKSTKLSVVSAPTIELEYHYRRETKGTWVYELPLGEGQRSSGSNQFYLLKSEYPERPQGTIRVVATIGE